MTSTSSRRINLLNDSSSMRFIFMIVIIYFFTFTFTNAFLPPSSSNNIIGSSNKNVNQQQQQCFCKLNGDVDDCDCKIETIDSFNNYKIQPRISSLVQKNYFRYIQLNLNKICKFWHDDARCSLKDCHVKVCTEDDLPLNFKTFFEESDLNINTDNYNHDYKDEVFLHRANSDVVAQTNTETPASDCEQSNPLGHLNHTLSEVQLKAFEEWKKYDDAQDNFCEPDDENLTNSKYIDLLTNPERYTGYKGPHAHKIWNSIYRENCFAENEILPSYGPEIETCLEKRVFHRLVSGLHASINIHLSAMYLHKGILDQPDYWAPNVAEFARRFNPETTNGQGPQWLKNLYFIYLVELRALAKVAPYLEKEMFFTGFGTRDDEDTKAVVLDLLKTAKSFKNHFDESILFRGNSQEVKLLKEQFKSKFRNITRIMDCVGCDKCRLWGKIQTKALGTALKILFSGKSFDLDSKLNATDKSVFQLTRNEIVSLFNGFARLSSSISHIEYFREELKKSFSDSHSTTTRLETVHSVEL